MYFAQAKKTTHASKRGKDGYDLYDFRRVLEMRGAMPNEDSVLVLMGKVAMDICL